MEFQQQHRKLLETVQEESEEGDETKGSDTREREEVEEEENFNNGVGVETEELIAEEESEEDADDAPLRVLRPGRMSRYLRPESFQQIQSLNNSQEEMENSSESDLMTNAAGLWDEDTPPLQERLGNERRSRSGELRRKFHFKVYKISPKKPKPPDASVQKKTNGKRAMTARPAEPFPDWLVSLMFNIEEATSHRLVVE